MQSPHARLVGTLMVAWTLWADATIGARTLLHPGILGRTDGAYLYQARALVTRVGGAVRFADVGYPSLGALATNHT